MAARVQAVPLQNEDVSFRLDDVERVRYNSGLAMLRPYLFPVIGPAGRMVTRMGHPHDPYGHRHHYSVWIAHQKVNGCDLWADHGLTGRQAHSKIVALEDGDASAALAVEIVWRGPQNQELLREVRTYRVTCLPAGELMIDMGLELAATQGEVRFGPTPFGLCAARVAKSMSVNDGDGTITNSAGAVGEEAIFWKPAEWCDYSGAVSPGVVNGIALFSHPANGNHPPDWHVRSDGWMGACLSRESECVVAVDAPLLLRYGLYVHRGGVDEAGVASRFEAFATSALAPCQA